MLYMLPRHEDGAFGLLAALQRPLSLDASLIWIVQAEHRKWASLFDKPCFLAPLGLQPLQKRDQLTKMHGNTHVPVAIGALHRHEVTGEPIFR